MEKINKQSGFTLIEILVVIGIIAVLAGIVLAAINPQRQFAQARDTQRTSNVEALLNAVGQRIADNKGLFPAVASSCDALPTPTASPSPLAIKYSGAPVAGTINLGCLTPTYIPVQLPVDPKTGTWTSAASYDTGYTLTVGSDGRVTIAATGEITNPIQITR